MRGVAGSSDTPERSARARAMRAWRAKHPDKAKKYCREWYAQYPEKMKGLVKRWRSSLKIVIQERRLALTKEVQKDLGPGCAICRSTKRELRVDHSHKTGNIRGLLCDRCNWALGMFSDNVNNLERAILYLKKSKTYGNYEALWQKRLK